MQRAGTKQHRSGPGQPANGCIGAGQIEHAAGALHDRASVAEPGIQRDRTIVGDSPAHCARQRGRAPGSVDEAACQLAGRDQRAGVCDEVVHRPRIAETRRVVHWPRQHAAARQRQGAGADGGEPGEAVCPAQHQHAGARLGQRAAACDHPVEAGAGAVPAHRQRARAQIDHARARKAAERRRNPAEIERPAGLLREIVDPAQNAGEGDRAGIKHIAGQHAADGCCRIDRIDQPACQRAGGRQLVIVGRQPVNAPAVADACIVE